MKVLRFLIAVSTMPLLAPAVVEACSCGVGGNPLCQSFWTTDAVFSGTVIDIASNPNPAGEFLASKRVRFQVHQSWRGSVSGVVEVLTGAGGGDCGYRFELGVSYLVYAHSRNGALSTGICNRTRRLADADEDLEYLKTALRPSATGRIFGTVRYQRDGSSPPPPERFIAGYEVELSDGRRTWKTKTNTDGRYEFTDIPAGPYTIKLATPATEHAYGPKEITLADPRGCAAGDFYVVPDGRVSVRIIDSAGGPVRGVRIELLEDESESPDRPSYTRQTSRTSDEGRIEFAQLHPKSYLLAINATNPPNWKQPYGANYYPGVTSKADARRVDLAPGERVDLGDWALPAALEGRQLSGQVLWPDGKPVAGAHVIVSPGPQTAWRFQSIDTGGVEADQAGRFTVNLFKGLDYEVHAYLDVGQPSVQWSTPRVRIPDTDAGTPVRLVLRTSLRR